MFLMIKDHIVKVIQHIYKQKHHRFCPQYWSVFDVFFFQLRIFLYSMETKLSKTRINFEYKRENDNCLLRHQFPHCYVAAKRKRKLFINVFMKTFTQTDVFFQYIVLLLYMLLGSCLFKELYNILIKARV